MEVDKFEMTTLWHKGWLNHIRVLKTLEPIHPEYAMRQHGAQFCNAQFVIWRAIELGEERGK